MDNLLAGRLDPLMLPALLRGRHPAEGDDDLDTDSSTMTG